MCWDVLERERRKQRCEHLTDRCLGGQRVYFWGGKHSWWQKLFLDTGDRLGECVVEAENRMLRMVWISWLVYLCWANRNCTIDRSDEREREREGGIRRGRPRIRLSVTIESTGASAHFGLSVHMCTLSVPSQSDQSSLPLSLSAVSSFVSRNPTQCTSAHICKQ